MKFLLADDPLLSREAGLTALRILTGLLMAYHGLDVLDSAKMAEYNKWDVLQKLPYFEFMVALGKWVELIAGFFLAIGLFTRLSALSIAAVMLFICFKVGSGKYYYEDQHPFLFAILAFVWFFDGAGPWSADRWLQKRAN
jgi:putative oxidoreductase